MNHSLHRWNGGFPRVDSVEYLMSGSALRWHGMSMTSRGNGWIGWPIIAGCILAALLSMGVLHVTGMGLLDPARSVISDYVLVSEGYALLAVAAVALATAALVVAAGLRRAGLPRPDLPVALLVSGAAALVVAAVFPTNLPGTPAGLVANVHRAGGGLAFGALPLAGWLVAKRAFAAAAWAPFAPLLRRCAGVTGLISATYLLIHVPIVIAGSPGFPYLGGAERVLCAAVMVVLLTTGRAARTAIEGARVTSAPHSGTTSAGSPVLADAGLGQPA